MDWSIFAWQARPIIAMESLSARFECSIAKDSFIEAIGSGIVGAAEMEAPGAGFGDRVAVGSC